MHTLLNRCDTEVVLKRADSLPGYCLSPNIHFLQRNLLEICQGSRYHNRMLVGLTSISAMSPYNF
jgi:hypothetical protein